MRLFPENPTDAELLQASRNGDMAAFDRFYRRHHEPVLGYCGQRVRDPEVAADLMAETFAAALAAVHDRARALPDAPLAWLFAIAQRKVIDSYRQGRVEDQARQRLGLQPLVLDDADIERIVEIAGRTHVATELARRVPEAQASALRACILDEGSYADIARELRCSEAVVRKRVSRALKALRTSIGDPT